MVVHELAMSSSAMVILLAYLSHSCVDRGDARGASNLLSSVLVKLVDNFSFDVQVPPNWIVSGVVTVQVANGTLTWGGLLTFGALASGCSLLASLLSIVGKHDNPDKFACLLVKAVGEAIDRTLSVTEWPANALEVFKLPPPPPAAAGIGTIASCAPR